jgi:hypothetical protein
VSLNEQRREQFIISCAVIAAVVVAALIVFMG